MKIAFESQLLLKGNKTGIACCADNLIKGLAQSSDYECQLNYFSKGVQKEKLDALEEYTSKGVKLNPCGYLKSSWYKLAWPFLGIPYHWFFGDDSQITQFFNYAIPPGVKGKKITMVHDMAHLACRETVRLKTRKWLDLTLKSSCRRADMIIAVSEFSKMEIMKYLSIPERKITVIHPGVNLELFHSNYDTEDIERVKRKYGIERDYILYLGTIEPRKNLQRLIEAYHLLLDKHGAEKMPQLVLAGGKGWLCDEIYKSAEKVSVKSKVLFTGYIGEDESPLLLSGAEFFCFPSIYEGFGIPPVEAMACGTPVLSANVASLPEILEEQAVYVDPFSAESIAEGMEKLLTDQELQEDLRQKGLLYVKRYDWKNSVDRLRSLYCILS